MSFNPPEVAWGAIAPVLVVLGAAVLGVLVEAFVPQKVRRWTQFGLTMAALAGAAVALAALWPDTAPSSGGGVVALGGSMVLDRPAVILQGALVMLGLLSVLVIADRTDAGQDAFAPAGAAVPGSDYERLATSRGLAQTEVYPLVLFALGGMMIFPATGDLLTLFVALEVLSLPLYLLTGLARRRRLLSQEASVKYFLLGAFASAVLLFGIALLYGYSGSVRLSEIATTVGGAAGVDPMLVAGLVMLMVGLLFKVGAVPFHSWTPDVYQGAPTPITGFMAACTKIAAFGALLRVVYVVAAPLQWDLMPLLWAVAAVTMVVGTVVALVQTDVKRLLAYSSIAHAGFVLVGVVALQQSGVSGVLFYLVAYGLATVGAFGIVTLVREVNEGPGGATVAEATALTQWTGLGRRHPLLAVTFTLFLLSFAGIPLTAGFIGKYAVFSAVVAGGQAWLAVLGVLASAAAVFFYVWIVVLMFFKDPEPGVAETTTVVRSEGLTAVAVGIAAVGTVALGVLPSWLLDLLGNAAVFVR
ncbi:NADH-quinone oxidoreductase subunit NuoN [Isoptericola sp. b441]|uniref:NADH-quinone oxidoreductase subunit N n=1 Tax=Actinotalea lenta TaxID=3064654 RepID=A0ABT9D4Y2_9CELL|nr:MULTISPECIES: NADH-quinone oxidoreductase subunit NuoN [unclassified Isoptericola]MDO8105785.1 NADH-quinone oxidoreductase subunit NuoN [Isoptericola sp. b441]MDO8122490.1 NADH-quinone oxidoreductase subunit NuoN [Isoptericola sp. b490]